MFGKIVIDLFSYPMLLSSPAHNIKKFNVDETRCLVVSTHVSLVLCKIGMNSSPVFLKGLTNKDFCKELRNIFMMWFGCMLLKNFGGAYLQIY